MVPTFFLKNFIDPPSWEELQRSFPEWGEIQRNSFPLNVKAVGLGNLKIVQDLHSESKECLEFFLKATAIINDPSFYTKLLQGKEMEKLKKTSFRKEEINKMEGRKIERTNIKPRCGVFGFKIVEAQKSRCRAIFDCDINKFIEKMQEYNLKNKERIRRELNEKDIIFIQFDFISFYDQFLLGEEVRAFFCFLGHDGELYSLRLLPMGLRLAVAAAQATMWQLLNFKRSQHVQVTTCIDNVAFAGPREEVYTAINTFLTRVCESRFSLNGMEDIDYKNLSDAQKRRLFSKLEEIEPEFLGEKYFILEHKRCLTDKTIKKLKMVWELLEGKIKSQSTEITPRKFYSLIGLLIFATSVLNTKTHFIYNFFRKIRQWGALLTENESLWDKPGLINLSPSDFRDLSTWVEISLLNRKVHIEEGKKTPTPIESLSCFYIITDASEWGWGAILFNKEKVVIKTASYPWPKGEGGYQHSSKAEPMGVVQAVLHFQDTIKNSTVAIINDHQPFIHAANRALFVHAYFYNKALEELAYLTSIKFFYYFIQGSKNPADPLSRNKALETETFPVLEAGAGLSSASLYPWQL